MHSHIRNFLDEKWQKLQKENKTAESYKSFQKAVNKNSKTFYENREKEVKTAKLKLGNFRLNKYFLLIIALIG